MIWLTIRSGPLLHDIGEFEVKHSLKLGVVNLYDDEIGNSAFPARLQQGAAAEHRAGPSLNRRRLLIGAGVAGLIVLLIIAGLWAFSSRARPKVGNNNAAMSTPFGRRLAVLPFKPIATGARDQVLEFGMADTLITKLSNSRELIVSSLPSVRKYSGLDQDPLTAGRELQVDSVLEGNVQRSGDQIRVTVRLIATKDGSSKWAGTFDEKFTDVFTVQDTISRKVADALALRLTGEEQQRLTRRYTGDVDAYQLYMTGRYHWAKLTPADIKKSIEWFQQAIDKDPGYALAYFGLAEAFRSLAINADIPSKDCLPCAKAAAIKALQIDPSLPEAHASLSFSLIWYDSNWADAEKEARRAVALNPNAAHAHFACAHVLSDLGRHDEAIVQMDQARQLDPVFPLYAALEGMLLLHAGHDAEAAVKLRNAAEMEPNFWVTYLILGRVDIQQQKYPEAITELEKARELSHGNSEAIGSIGYAAAMAGDKAKAHGVLQELQNLSTQRYIPPYNIALVYCGLGEQDSALSKLEKACDDRDVRVTLLRVDPRWNSLRSQPQFQAILRRIGLAQAGK